MLSTARRAWWAVFAWCVLILGSVPLARALQDRVRDSVGRQAYLWVVMALLALAVAGGVWATWRRFGPELWRRLPWLLGAGGVCGAYAWHLRHAPEEALHFIEYGALALLLVAALRHHLADAGLFVVALLLGTLFGVLDEFVQWLVPGRFWDLRDVFVNSLALALALVALVGGMRPPELGRRPTLPSLRWSCALAASLALLLGLALSNTPARTLALVRLVPALSYMVDHGTVMTEYGYLHRLPDGGGLYSRLSWAQLREQDQRRAGEVARILDGYPGDDDYKLFLRDYPPFGDSYTHELRVHLFRRDRFLQRLEDPELPVAEGRRMATTAWGEERLLQACCAATVAASSYALPAERWEPLAAWIEPSKPYTSAVSSHLIVRFRQHHAWAVVLLLWLLLAALVGFVSRSTSPGRPRSR